MMRGRWFQAGILLAIFLAVLLIPDVSWAAVDNTAGKLAEENFQKNVIDFGSTINATSFQSTLLNFYKGMKNVFMIIITILTVASGMMVLFGIEDGKKTMWQFMLGIGLAVNFGGALYEIFNGTGLLGQSVDQVAQSVKDVDATTKVLSESAKNGNSDILTEIMAFYSGTIIHKSVPVLTAVAIRMTLVLAAIEGGYKIAVDLVRGDKIHFIVAMVFKVGFFLFLITNWLHIGQALSGFFQAAGFMAGGELDFSTDDSTKTDDGKKFRPDSIVHNAIAMFSIIMNGNDAAGAKATGVSAAFGFASAVGGGIAAAASGISLLSPAGWIPLILTMLFLIFIVGLLLFTSVEMFIARIEFYTFLMLSIVFLPFGVTERLSFLSNAAISLIFNSGAKMMVISFLQVMIATMLSNYFAKLTLNPINNFPVLIQMFVMSAFFAYITKKLPEMVSAFLNGSPTLSGGGFMQQAKSVASTAVTATGTVVGAAAGASAATAGNMTAGTGKMSALKKTAGTVGTMVRSGVENVAARNPLTQSFARGAKAVIGQDGSLQDSKNGFAQRVQRLAGMTVDGKDGENKSIFSRAANPGESGSSGKGGSGNGQGNPNGRSNTPPGFGAPGGVGGSKKNVTQTVNNMFQQAVSQQNVSMNDAKNNTNVQMSSQNSSTSSQNNSSTAQGSGPSVNQTINNTNQQTMSKNEYKNNSSMFTMSQLNNYK